MNSGYTLFFVKFMVILIFLNVIQNHIKYVINNYYAISNLNIYMMVEFVFLGTKPIS